MTIGDQESVDTFGDTKTTTQKLGTVSNSSVKYELVSEVAKRTTLTHRTTATMIVEHIQYDRIDQTYDSEIFTQEKHAQNVSKSYSSKKHIMDYVFTDFTGERTFAEDLDAASEVCV